jgi:hypothetical protein
MNNATNEKHYNFNPATSVQWEQQQAIAQMRLKYDELAEMITKVTPNSRERSNALTELKRAAFWTTDAIAHNGVREEWFANKEIQPQPTTAATDDHCTDCAGITPSVDTPRDSSVL